MRIFQSLKGDKERFNVTHPLVSGDVPYPGVQTKDLLESLKSGHRMDKPVKTSTVV